MANTAFKGNPIKLEGNYVKTGEKAPEFQILKDDLSPLSLSDMKDKVKLLVAVPSLDTPVCALETKKFYEQAKGLDGIQTVIISGDLPFAMKRFCTAEGIQSDSLVTGSQFRDFSFSKAYGVHMADGPLAGLSARAVFVVDKDNKVVYEELVADVTQEPKYDSAIEAAKKAAG